MTVKVMNINDLAEKIANEFREEVKGHGCESFKEMADCFGWEAYDIREEITYMQTEFLNDEYDELVEEYGEWSNIPCFVRGHICVAYDDGSIICENEEMTYGQFKKLVLSKI